jgi:hypothetical protein
MNYVYNIYIPCSTHAHIYLLIYLSVIQMFFVNSVRNRTKTEVMICELVVL